MEKILVAIDGSETSKRALAEARVLAECRGSKVKIIHIRPDVETITNTSIQQFRGKHMSPEDEKEFSESLLEEGLKMFEGYSGEVSTSSRMGNAADEIIEESRKGNHDLIIMGSRGLGTFSRTILGSVTNKVLNYSKNKVLVVRWKF